MGWRSSYRWNTLAPFHVHWFQLLSLLDTNKCLEKATFLFLMKRTSAEPRSLRESEKVFRYTEDPSKGQILWQAHGTLTDRNKEPDPTALKQWPVVQ